MVGLNLEKIQENTWAQGVIIANPLREALMVGYQFSGDIKDTDLLVLYTHDCDLINLNLEKEPCAEFFCVRKIESIDGNYAYGKNPRMLHLETGESKLEFDINRTLKIDRSVLTKHALKLNGPKIPRSKMVDVLNWLSKKYSRSAFPEEFNNILKQIPKLDSGLTKIYETFPVILKIFFLINPDKEIEPSEKYNLRIYVLLKGISLDEDQNIKDEIIPLFEELFRVKRLTTEVECGFLDEMTLYELGIYKLWDKEYITLKEEAVS